MSRAAFALDSAQSSKDSKSRVTNLRINKPNDAYEREADHVAEQIVSGAPHVFPWSLSTIGISPPLQRECSCGGQCDDCKKEKKLQRKAHGSATPDTAPPIVHDVLRAPGRPMEPAVRSFMESRFKHDFSRVRIHADARAAESADAVNAHAYTAASNVVFGPGRYAPHSQSGRQLLAHELAHVVQQGAAAPVTNYRFLAPDHHAEQEAKDAGSSVTSSHTPQVNSRIPGDRIGRVEKDGTPPTPSGGAGATPGPTSASASGGTGATSAAPPAKPQPLRFDVLGADTPLADFLAKEAKVSRDPDLRVNSLEDLIDKLEAQTPAGSGRCVEHISIFNHGAPGYQAIAGEGAKKGTGPSGPTKLPRSALTLDWLYAPANQAALVRLRKVFCCGASMDWLGCGVAGVTAQGGKRTSEEIENAGKIGSSEKHDLDERYKEYGDRYQSEEDALKHGASLQGATFGKVTVGTWADATCTSIRAATDFVFHNADKGTYRVGFHGESLQFNPSKAGQCTCDPASGRVQGKWDSGKGIDPGTPKWQADLARFNQAVNPSSGAGDKNLITHGILDLLADVASELEIPPGLSVGPKVEPWVDAASTNPNVVARTYDHLALCNPTDAWKWIGVNRTVIQQTPSYTKTTLNHELMHAADIAAAALKYKQANGPPPPAPADAYRPGYSPVETDPFGKYLIEFRKFRSAGLPESRHLEIYANSAEKNFQRFSPEEKLSWFSSMITEVPPDVPVSNPLATEPLVAGVFDNPVPYEAGMRQKFEAQLFKVTNFYVYGDNAERGVNLGKARTLVNHFGKVWAITPGDRGMLAHAIDLESKRKPPPKP